MGIRRMLLQLTIIGCRIILAAAAEQPSLPFPIAKPGCQDKCGNVSIPYPFGTTENCFHSQHFRITCNDTYYDPPKAFLERSNISVTKITLQGKLHILQYIAHDCYDESGIRLAYNTPYLYLPTFIISYTDNKFIAVGCDTKAYVAGSKGEEEYIVGCMSLCDSIDYESHNTCSGIGCCQTSIPKGVTAANLTLNSYYNHTEVWKFNPCSYAFIVEENQFNFSSTSLRDLKECLKGYQGNPYLPGGCRDVNECEVPDLNNCEGNCVNTEGSYICICPKGYHGDGNKSGQGCILGRSKVILVTIENCLAETLEDCVINGENLEHLNEVACLARRCVRVKGDERPTMKEVAMELEGMRIMAQHPWVNNESNLEETEQLLGESLDTVSYGCGTSSSYDSMKNQVTVRVCDTR
ncbi:hypothetical protein Patl1_25765 [Pistacia atlantica]|uniref:Uncharacterized protein n=1 Tax=Pistacia atlantica TaxID=434234 RepID=A0ACC1B302_9ROSI|nr:hypothetical protein Patl1_25765 [Pistacia atlantica]